MIKNDDLRSGVRLALFDVDGVLTDGTLYIGGGGEACKPFNARDGVAVALLRAHGIKSGIVSGKTSSSLDFRARQLKFDVLYTGVSDKLAALDAILSELKLSPTQVCFIGDDVMDLNIMESVGVSYAPRDAHPLVLECADYISEKRGGHGVARDVAEDILMARGLALKEMYRFMLKESRKASLDIVQ